MEQTVFSFMLTLFGYGLFFIAGSLYGNRIFQLKNAVSIKKSRDFSNSENRMKNSVSDLKDWSGAYTQKLLKLSSSFQTVPVLSESFMQMSATIQEACETMETACKQNIQEKTSKRQETKRRIKKSFQIPENNRGYLGSSFGVYYGTAKKTKPGQDLSGDHFTCIQITKDKILFGLCDGMGSGKQADAYARRMLETLEELCIAGFSVETSLHMLHTMMLYEHNEDTTLVLDLCLLSLKTGELKMVKAGAAPSFFMHEGVVTMIEGESLPIGILKDCDFFMTTQTLSPGDRLIMMTDGVSEALGEAGQESCLMLLPHLNKEHSALMHAKKILDYALSWDEATDDMLVLDLEFCDNN